MGFLPWKIRLAFPGESQLGQSRTTQSTVHAGCFSVSIIHQTLTLTTGFLTCAQTLMPAVAHGGARTHVGESALKVDWEKNPLPHRGIEPASAACRSDALLAEPHPHLSGRPKEVVSVFILPRLWRFCILSFRTKYRPKLALNFL